MIEYADNASLGDWFNPFTWGTSAPSPDVQRIADAIASLPGYARKLAEQSRAIAARRAQVGPTKEVLDASAKARDGWQNLRRLNNIALTAWAQARQAGKVEGEAPTTTIDTGEEGLSGYTAAVVTITAGVALVILGVFFAASVVGTPVAAVLIIVGGLTTVIGALAAIIEYWSQAAQTPAAPDGGSAPNLPSMIGGGIGLWALIAAVGLFTLGARRRK